MGCVAEGFSLQALALEMLRGSWGKGGSSFSSGRVQPAGSDPCGL